ncbi:hypothetical protein J2TS6_35180 [Paenibacillus albilobatus]|uniref:Uncharacterized protein n=1 Tax=Paenibacillus albilobatus TaxID=2716884 RepID=A0A919XKH0_9BACL|nr:hypothetical protein J2TS6_35180 [Paenibacillus albilobatus]
MNIPDIKKAPGEAPFYMTEASVRSQGFLEYWGGLGHAAFVYELMHETSRGTISANPTGKCRQKELPFMP